LAGTDEGVAPLRLACVLGTRPEAIKLAPIVLAARESPARFAMTVIATGQHGQMAASALAQFGLTADLDLHVMEINQRPTDVIARTLLALPAAFEHVRPDAVLVQGDTSSTFAGAIGAYHEKIPVGHVEAGLRTNDIYSPFPEEMNRRLVSVLSSFHFAPTDLARRRLLAEAIPGDRVLVSGNTVVDALRRLRTTAAPPAGVSVSAATRMILLTCHRRENHGERMDDICRAVREIVEARGDVTVVCPVHPSPLVAPRMRAALGRVERVTLLEPVEYAELLWLMEASTLVLTDSGGLQEEAPAFNKPVLVLRDVTERPEGIDAGVARLVGTDRATIVRETLRLLDDEREYRRMAGGANPYGDGRASERILTFLLAHVGVRRAASAVLARE
jgi:UDP-N-acetylglucosamine 2-epimerase (non-hydrolysing)